MFTHTTYHPKITDPRCQRRIRHALGFALATLSEHEPRAWSTRYIDRHFGQQQHPLSQWLREILLITHSDHWSWNQGQCKQYLVNSQGVAYLTAVLRDHCDLTWSQWLKRSLARPNTSSDDSCLSELRENETTTHYIPYCITSHDHTQKETTTHYIPYCITSHDHTQNETTTHYIPYCITSHDHQAHWDREVVRNWAQREFGSQLTTLEFEYKDQSHRLWNPIQNIKSTHRRRLLADSGLIYHYDISVAAPTLIHQRAQQLGQDQVCWNIQHMIDHKTQVREQLAQDLALPVSQIKILINALFCGARVGHNPQFATTQILNRDPARIELVKQHAWICQLRTEIHWCWQVLNQTIPPRFNAQTLRRLPVTSRQRWQVYFALERQVLDSVRIWLRNTQNPCFLEHDGWTTGLPVNTLALCDHIRTHTGFDLQIEESTHHL